MEDFINETIDTTQLPQFEEVEFSSLHPNYWKVTLINLFFFFLLMGIGVGLAFFFNEAFLEFRIQIISVYFVLLTLVLFFSRISFRKKGFAFRNHDVLFRHGVTAKAPRRHGRKKRADPQC